MEWEEATDYVFSHILYWPTDERFSFLNLVGWLLFLIGTTMALAIMLFGNFRRKEEDDGRWLAHRMKRSNNALFLGLGIALWYDYFSLGSTIGSRILLLAFILALIPILIVSGLQMSNRHWKHKSDYAKKRKKHRLFASDFQKE